jgi:predicted RNA-binding protein YlxR (DUF448 family)
MSEATMHMEDSGKAEANGPRARTRTCVGCGERVDVLGPDGADLVRLVLGPDGEIAVDAASRRGGGFGRGAHVHARRACVERAARSGLLRATKGKAHFQAVTMAEEAEKSEGLSTDSLARAIQRSMDRRIEGLLGAAVRSRQVARGADAVTGACQRGEAELVVVACDAAAAADLTEVRRAVAEGRAVAWGTKMRLGAIVAPLAVRGKLPAPHDGGGPPPQAEGVGVVAIASRTIAEALRRAVQAANAVTSAVTAGHDGGHPRGSPGRGPRRAKDRRSDG